MFLQLIHHHITSDHIYIYIYKIPDKHAGIKHGLIEIWPKLIGYHQYYVKHLTNNFNHKFKDFSAKKEFFKMCYKALKHKFNVWFEDMGNSHLQ
jgi:hypothetical protein